MKDKCGVKVRWRVWLGNGKRHEAKGQPEQLQKVQWKLQKGHWLSKGFPVWLQDERGPAHENSLCRLTLPHIIHLLSFLSGTFFLIKWTITFFFSSDDFLPQWIFCAQRVFFGEVLFSRWFFFKWRMVVIKCDLQNGLKIWILLHNLRFFTYS